MPQVSLFRHVAIQGQPLGYAFEFVTNMHVPECTREIHMPIWRVSECRQHMANVSMGLRDVYERSAEDPHLYIFKETRARNDG